MKYRVEIACEKGVVRRNNEDAVRYGANRKLGILWMLVADGMGGHNAGEVASQMLAAHVEKSVEHLTWLPKQGWSEWVKQELFNANCTIYKASNENIDYQGMGTTGVLLLLVGNQCYIGWVGDSRAYLLRKERLIQQTLDHSMIQFLLDKGAITSAEAAVSNTKHLLSRAIGIKEKVEVDVKSLEISPGDILMLSTDGVHDYLSNEVIQAYMLKYAVITNELNNSDIQRKDNSGVCEDMVNQAIAQSSKDNLTIGLIKVYN
jgi:PPM family protein phosphatase